MIHCATVQTQNIKIELSEEAKPYNAKPLPNPKIHKENLKIVILVVSNIHIFPDDALLYKGIDRGYNLM